MFLLFVVCLIHIWLSADFRVRTTVILSQHVCIHTLTHTDTKGHARTQHNFIFLYIFIAHNKKKSFLFKARVLYSKSSFHLNLLLLLHLWSVAFCLSSKYQKSPNKISQESSHCVSLRCSKPHRPGNSFDISHRFTENPNKQSVTVTST